MFEVYYHECNNLSIFLGRNRHITTILVYTFMMSLPDPEEWLEMACGGVPEQIDSSHPWFRYAGESIPLAEPAEPDFS